MKTDTQENARLSAFHDMLARDVPNQLFMESSEALIAADSRTLRIISINRAAQRMFGWSQFDARQRSLEAILPQARAGRVARFIERFAQSGRKRIRFPITAGITARGGVTLSVLELDGPPSTIVVVVQSNLRHLAALEAAQRAENRLKMAIEALPDGFVLYDADDRLAICNARYREIYAPSAPAMQPGTPFEDILRYGLERGQYHAAIGREEEWLAERMEAHLASDSVVEQHLSDGRWLRVHEHRTSDGGRVGLRVDITLLKEQQKRLREIAHRDELTGLYNRPGLIETLQSMNWSADDFEMVLFHIDLERFKNVNEAHGYEAGDRVLQVIADRLRRHVRQQDILARIGADEFVLVQTQPDPAADHLKTAKRLIRLLSSAIPLGKEQARLYANIGIAARPQTVAGERDSILVQANLALKVAKGRGRNEAVMFHRDMQRQAELTHDMASEIERGLRRGEIKPFLQPQINTRTGRVVGFEALVRWEHPERGLVPAFQFLDVAQGAGLTEAIDNLMMDKSCTAVRQMIDWGMRDAVVSINVSVPQISDPNIYQRLRKHMAHHRIEPRHLHIELLESTLLDHRSGQIVDNVRGLIDAGFSIELDDFGTGHAAIATLRKFDVARIKVDRSLVQNIHEDPALQVITSAVIKLAAGLGIDSLAEGVETDAEQAELDKIGCHCAQGYLHARPMPLEAVREFMIARGELT